MRLANMIAMLTLATGWQAAGQQSLDQILNKGVVLPGKKAPAPEKQRPAPTAKQPRSVASAASGGAASFKMDLPPGWRAQLAQNGAVVARGQDNLAVVIAPVPDAGDAPAANWLQARGAAALAPYVTNPAITRIYPSRVGPHAALAAFEFGDSTSPGTANVLCFVGGGVGTLYIIAGPKPLFLQARAGLVRILQSFSFAGERAEAGQAGQQTGFTRFQDPLEKAFTMDVPAGWKIEGGLLRKSPVDVRNYVWATSPDGSTVIRARDPAFGRFMVPDRTHEAIGVREGTNYQVGIGWTAFVLRYVSGPDFARQYAVKLISDLNASDLQTKAVKPRQDLAKSETATGGFSRIETTAGEVEFTCSRNGQPCNGKVVAATRLELMSSDDPLSGRQEFGGWTISYLASYLTPPERLAMTEQIFQHMLDSVHFSEEWGRMQTQIVVDAAQANRGLSQYRDRILDEVYRNRERSEERIHQNRIDAIRGVVRLRDPDTGQELEGVAGRNYYYRITGGDRAISTDREIRSPDFTELEQIR